MQMQLGARLRSIAACLWIASILVAAPVSVFASALGSDKIFVNGFEFRPIAGEMVITEIMANPAGV